MTWRSLGAVGVISRVSLTSSSGPRTRNSIRAPAAAVLFIPNGSRGQSLSFGWCPAHGGRVGRYGRHKQNMLPPDRARIEGGLTARRPEEGGNQGTSGGSG